MATRAAREKNSHLNEHHKKILADLMGEEANMHCADCRRKGQATWASWNLGTFICIRCSGIHRCLGVHISKVRSIRMDMWQPEWIASMQEWGNERAADQWEYHLPDDFSRPAGSDQAMDQFIRNKYERKKWIRKASDPKIREPKFSPKAAAEAAPAKELTHAEIRAQMLAEEKEKKARKKAKKKAKKAAKAAAEAAANGEEASAVSPEPSETPITSPEPEPEPEEKEKAAAAEGSGGEEGEESGSETEDDDDDNRPASRAGSTLDSALWD